MRRRVWCFVQGLDILTSFLVGLPGMIRSIDSDTRGPRNLHDWEMNEGMKSLPESRPLSEETPVCYMLAKRMIVTVSGDAISLVGSLTEHSYDEILRLDNKLMKAYRTLPPHLKMESPDKLLKESPALTNRRIQLEFLYHQTVCILHRKFLSRGRTDTRYARSYQRCMESALRLLEHQQFLYTETKIKGSMRPRHWYRVVHTSHDFILAAMIVGLDVRYRSLEKLSGRIVNFDESEQMKIWQALEFVCGVWKGEKDISPEAAKVYRVLSQVLGTCAIEENGVVQGQAVLPAAQIGVELPLLYDNQQVEVPEGSMDIDWVRLSFKYSAGTTNEAKRTGNLGFIHRRSKLSRHFWAYLIIGQMPHVLSFQVRNCLSHAQKFLAWLGGW
jgi:hypothetical protein